MTRDSNNCKPNREYPVLATKVLRLYVCSFNIDVTSLQDFIKNFFPLLPFAKIIKLGSEDIFTREYCTYFAREKTEFCNCCRETYLIYFPWNANFLTVLPVGATWNSNGNFTLDSGRGQIVRLPDKWKNAAFDIVGQQRFQSDSNWIEEETNWKCSRKR